MGYTHYWNGAGFTVEQWAQLQECTQRIIRRARSAGVGVADWGGTGAPDIGPDAIRLNGRGPNSFETFALARDGDSSFCKTGRRRYDAIVVAILTVAARIAPDAFRWSSDGEGRDHEPGRALARDLPTPGAWGGGCQVRI